MIREILVRNSFKYNAALLVCIVLIFPLAMLAPMSWGWENGVLENLQVLVLFSGLAFAVWSAYRRKGTDTGHLWMIAIPLWATFVARELSWGAAIFPLGYTEAGAPIVSSAALWYKPMVAWIVGALLVYCIYVFFRYRIWKTVIYFLLRNKLFPITSLLIFIAAMVISALAEGHGLPHLHDIYQSRSDVLEEFAELIGYSALFVFQKLISKNLY